MEHSHESGSVPEPIALNPHFREQEQALLSALLQATDYGILMTGLDRQDIVANRRMGELFAVVPEAIVENPPEQVGEVARARVRDPEVFEALLRQTYADAERTFEDEVELVTDPPRILRRYTGPVRDGNGSPLGRLWTFQDITETRRLQAEVQHQLAARTADFQETSNVLQAMNAICRLPAQHKTTEEIMESILKVVRPLFGFCGAALLLTAKDDVGLQGAFCRADDVVASLKLSPRDCPEITDAMRMRRDAPAFPFLLSSHPLSALASALDCPLLGVAPLVSDGVAFGGLAVGLSEAQQDDLRENCHRAVLLGAIIDQIALTLETHRLQAELRRTMETLQAAQSRMVEVEKLRTAGTLAASVAHDIRNILTAMQMEIAQQEQIPDTLCDQMNRFAALTHRLLAFSRPGALETRPISLADVVGRIVPLVAGQAEINGVAIEVSLPDHLPAVAADASQLENVFVNLCLNAIQAMAATGGVLTLAGRAQKNWLEITVEDTGCGIAPGTIDRIFEPFFTTRTNGFGLGLFSCKRIVEEHGGQLTAWSAPGQGARFTVLLPVLRARSSRSNGKRKD